MRTVSCILIMAVKISFSQTGANKSFLYLQNQRTAKIKKINLSSSHYISYNLDSSADYFYSYSAWESFTPENCAFGENGVDFHFSAASYNYWTYSNDVELMDSWNNYYDFDTSTFFPYTNESNGFDIFLSRQSKAGRIFFVTGAGIVYLALVNAFLIAPMRGLNAGSFNGYSTQRLWQGEMYSGFALAVGLPLILIFDHKKYYFQDRTNKHDTWEVVTR